MGSYDSGRAADFGGISIEARRADSLNGIRFDSNRDAPTSANDVILYRGAGSSLRFWGGSSATTLGSAGGLVNFSLNDGYDDGSSITVDGDAVTLNGSHATNNLLNLRYVGSGTGNMIDIQNDSTGSDWSDIIGTDNTWAVSSAGALTCISIADSATDATLQVNGNGTGGVTIGGVSSGIVTITPASTLTGAVTATTSITITGSAGANVFTVSAGDLVVTDGSITLSDADQAVTVSVTNNTSTTANMTLFTGSGTFTGTGANSFFNVTQSGLTSGTAFTVIANAGTTSVGIVDFSMTALSSGSALRVTGGGTAMTSGGKVIEVAMGAATDGVGMTITTTGAYVGAGVLQIVANSATSATGLLDVSATGLPSGSAVLITSSTANFTTGGKMIELAMVAATAGNGLTVTTTGAYPGTGMILVTAGAATTGILVSLVSTTGMTTGSLLRGTTSTAGALATNGVFSFSGTGAHTSTSNTGLLDVRSSGLVGTGTLVNFMTTAAAQLTDTVLNIEMSGFTTGYTGTMVRITSPSTTGACTLVTILGDAMTTDGRALDISVDALTTGIGLNIANSGGAMTTGSLVRVAVAGTGAIATNGIISFSHTGAFTSTSATDGGFVEIKANDTTAGVVLNLVADALTTGLGVHLSNGTSAMTSGSLLRVTASGTGAIATNGLVSFTHNGVFTSTSATDGGFVEIKANDTTAGTVLNLVADALTTGLGVHLSNGSSAMTSGSLLRVTTGGTGAIATNGIVSFTHTGNFTSTSAIDGGFVEIKANDTTAGTVFNLVADALTTGIGMHISNGTVATTTGSLLRVTAGGTGAVATNGIVSFVHTGIYTSTTVGFVNISASGTTGGTVATVTGAAVTDGVGLQISNAAITTGRHLSILGAAGATMFSVLVNGATTIAGSASGTAALTITAGDILMSAGILRQAVTATITADVGSVQGGSPLTRGVNEVSVCANSGDAVTLPAAAVGQTVYIVNHGAASCDVFPASGDNINEVGADTAKALAVNAAMVCYAWSTGDWECNTLAR